LQLIGKIDKLKRKAYESDAIPSHFTHEGVPWAQGMRYTSQANLLKVDGTVKGLMNLGSSEVIKTKTKLRSHSFKKKGGRLSQYSEKGNLGCGFLSYQN